MNQWLRNNDKVAMVLAVLRIYLGYTWLMAGIGKVTGGFETSGFLQGAIGKAEGAHPAVQPWWGSILRNSRFTKP